MIETIGWLGSFLFALCALPQTIKTIKTKSADDFSSAFLVMWASGEVCMIIYAFVELNSIPLLFNYIGNLVCLLPILFYKIKNTKS